MSETTWRAIPSPTSLHAWSVARVVPLVNGDARVEYVHPIGFTEQIGAERAAARLNARDAGVTGEPVPTPPEDQVKAARQSRLAELRAKRDTRRA